jgi:hypothetical protein
MLHEWTNFYITTGAASASLIGLLFVVVTLGARMPRSDVVDGVRAFLMPALVHFCVVLLISLAVLSPFASPWPLAVIFCLGGLGGMAYLTKNVLMRRKVDFVSLYWLDWIPYAVVPALGNAGMIAGAAGLIAEKSFALYVIAGATALSLFLGIYEAADLTFWIIRNGRERQRRRPPPRASRSSRGSPSNRG